jgi:cell division protein FtsQ
MADVRAGDRLLAIDPDAVAARIARHPWVASVRVRRQLPSVLRIDVRERTAAAVAALGGLYLVDDTGRPFKRATMDEADGLPVLTGLDRGHYAQLRDASEAAFREALGIAAVYRARAGRPPVSEVNVDPRFGFTLFLQGGTEVRLGRGDYGKKLARLDQILEAVKAAGATGAIKAVGLDGASGGRIPVRLEKRDL